MQRDITLSLPDKTSEKVATLTLEATSPYTAIEKIRGQWQALLTEGESAFAKLKIRELLPLHNETGIRDPGQIKRMKVEVGRGEQILEKDNLPNVKLVVVPSGELLVFDGHHTLLSYLQQGKELLREIPFIAVSSKDYGPVTSGEIACFFPTFAKEKVSENWRKYVVNWQASGTQQLEERKVNTFEELALKIGKGNKTSG